MATVQEILTDAYSHSTKNAPGRIITESTEGLSIVKRATAGLFAFGARVNREFFGKTSTVAAPGAGTPWDRPSDAESIFRLEDDASGEEIVRVPMDDRTNESGKPAVYRFGQAYYTAGNALDPDPALDAIKFYYSAKPTEPALLADSIDPLWPEVYNELLALDVAIYIAIKDGRGEEVQSLRFERDKWLQLFVAFLEHEDVGERRRFDHDRRFNAPTMVPLQQLVAGGSALTLNPTAT